MRTRGGAAVVLALACALTPAPVAAQGMEVVLVVGLGGAPEFAETFHGWAMDLHDAATGAWGVPADRVTYLGPDPSVAPAVIRARSTREELDGALADVAARAGADDRVLVVFIGHGTARDGDASFNLPGPDVSGADVTEMLGRFPTQTVAVVNTAPSSGPFVAALSGPRRIVLTATRNARERNETRFGRFFVEAVGGAAADLDKDGRISLLEAFEYARSEVARHYEEQNLLLTEHALLDDDGDGKGSEEPDPDAADGALARTFWVGAAAGAAATAVTPVPEDVQDPELRALYQEKADLERRIDAHRQRRGTMAEAEYERVLEDLLVELALKNRLIRAKEGGGR